MEFRIRWSGFLEDGRRSIGMVNDIADDQADAIEIGRRFAHEGGIVEIINITAESSADA